MQRLRSASENLESNSTDDWAELSFSLWLAGRMEDQPAAVFERIFKHCLERGFRRPKWSFDRMLEQAKTRLSPEELAYAQALAAAFLDESKVAELQKFPRWVTLTPLDPSAADLSAPE